MLLSLLTDVSLRTDLELLAEASAGVREAWDTIEARHRRRILVSLLGLGLGVEEARDVSQDAWSRVWQQHRAGALAELVFPGIVITQARFLAHDLLRRRRLAPEGGEVEAQSADPTAEDRLVAAQSLARVQRSLAQVTPSKREVFRLACDEGLPHVEIARRVGLSTQRVKQVVWEVRTILRAAQELP